MIISKAALQLVELTSPDKDIPVLDCVCIEPNGIVVAMNKFVVGAVLPLDADVLANIPLDAGKPILKQTLFSASTIRGVLKTMPKDRTFKGMLEYCDISPTQGEDSTAHIVTVHDGRVANTSTIQAIRVKYTDYREEFRNALALQSFNPRFIVNRKRFKVFVDVLEKICPYSGDFSPVYLEQNNDEYIVARSSNEINKQVVVVVLRKTPGVVPGIHIKERLLYVKPATRINT
jgi:hypothetical protein